MALTEKKIIDFARFELYRVKKAAAADSIMSDYHQKAEEVLSVLLESYIRLNKLEKESLRRASMNLEELLSTPTDKPKEPEKQEIFRAKNHRREP